MTLPDESAIRERYPTLWQLFAGYFHQDWSLDDHTADDVLGRFVRDEPADAFGARNEISTTYFAGGRLSGTWRW